MKTTAFLFIALAIVAAIMGLWVLVGVAAWVVRVLAFIFLVIAVLSARRRLTEGHSDRALHS